MLTDQIRKRQAEQDVEDNAGKQAAATPLPGALRSAFAPQPFITVDEFKVRPFCDADFEALQFLDSPIQKMVAHAFEGEASNDKDIDGIIRKLSRGADAWNLCYVLTTEPDELDELFKNQGVNGVKAAAKQKFRRLQTAAVIQIVMACIEQFNKSWETMVGMGAPKEKEAASSSLPP